MQRNLNAKALGLIQSHIQNGLNLAQLGQLDAAIESFAQVLVIDAIQPQALNALAELYRQKGCFDVALDYAQRLHACAFNNAIYFNTRGAIHSDLKQYNLAVADYETAIKIDKKQAAPYINLINSLRANNRTGEAIGVFNKAKKNAIKHAGLHNNIGSVYFEIKDYANALTQFETALLIDANYTLAQENIFKLYIETNTQLDNQKILEYSNQLNNNASVLKMLLSVLYENKNIQLLDKILRKYFTEKSNQEIYLLLNTDSGLNICFYLLNYYTQSNRYDEAKMIYEKLNQISEYNVAIRINLGSLEFSFKYYELALEQFKIAITLDAGQALSYRNAGACCLALGQTLEALNFYEMGYQKNPSDQHTIVQILSIYLQIAKWDKYEGMLAALKLVMQSPLTDPIGSLQILSLSESIAEQYDYLRKVAPFFFEKKYDLNICDNKYLIRQEKSKKIRLAYLSYDFRNHPVSYLTLPMYKLHDRSKFEIVAYSYGPDDGSEYRKKIASDVDFFIDCKDMSPLEMAQKIHSNNIDVLIDLTGNTQNTRSNILTHRVADIQMHWLGYISTMGSDVYDYIIADDFTIPKNLEMYYSEKIIKLPNTLQINDAQRIISDKIQCKQDFGLPENAFVFCNFGQIFKIQPKLFLAWVEILKKTPNSVLWLAEQDPLAKSNLIDTFIKHGIEINRIIFAARLPIPEYLARYRLADLMLDTYPVGSGTSASDCLWAGCPLLMLAGEIMYSRMCGGILKAANLDNFITYTMNDYIDKAVYFANNKNELIKTKEKLLKNKNDLPLFNSQLRVTDLETCIESAITNFRNSKNK